MGSKKYVPGVFMLVRTIDHLRKALIAFLRVIAEKILKISMGITILQSAPAGYSIRYPLKAEPRIPKIDPKKLRHWW